MAVKVMTAMLEKSKELRVLENTVKITSSVSEENKAELEKMAEELSA